jgi:uncharacterized protein with PIN domain
MLKFHLDEHVPNALANGLRQHGVDVTTTADAGLLNAGDPAQLAYAATEGRVIITHDDDFLRLHAAGTTHGGIAYCHQNKYSVGELLPLLLLMNACYSADDMLGRVEFL